MRRFEYRAPRFSADVSVRLILKDFTVAGRCVQLSSEGMRAKFDQALEANAHGAVAIAYQDVSIEIPVQVAHCAPHYEGLRFLFESDLQRNSVERLIGLITEPPVHRGLTLVR